MPYKPFASQFRTTGLESSDCETGDISVGQKKLERRAFAGFTGRYIRSRLSKQDFLTLGTDHQQAVLLYWDAVLVAERLPMTSGSKVGREALVYGPDIRVLDFFAEDKTYDIPQDTGERLEEMSGPSGV